MNMLRIICTECGRDMQVITAGILIKELFQKNKEVYRVWAADYLGCPECGKEVISRFADKPIAEHFDKEKMADILLQCETRTLGVDLFEWKEFVPKEKKRGGCSQPH